MSTDDATASRGRELIATIDDLPVAAGVAGGVGAFGLGYAAFTAVLGATGSIDFRTPVRALKQVGFLFYNAHAVPIVRRRELARTVSETDPDTGAVVNATEAVVDQERFNLLLQADPSLPLPAYFAVPVLVLLLVGGWLARRYVGPHPGRSGLALIGGATLGYLLVALLGTFLAVLRATEGQSSETLAPARPYALGAGVAYPLVATGVAVVLVVAWRRHRGTARTRSGR